MNNPVHKTVVFNVISNFICIMKRVIFKNLFYYTSILIFCIVWEPTPDGKSKF